MKVKCIEVFRGIWYAFPEGVMKDAIRRLALHFFRSYPSEFTLRSGETMVQVGAPPEGEISRLSRMVGKKGRVIAIEAERKNLQGLQRVLSEKSIQNVTLVNKGAWREKGVQRLLLSPHPGDHKIAVEGVIHDNDLRAENYHEFVDIEVDSVDNILRDLEVDSVDHVKITINGAELEVLRGMEDTLKRISRIWVKGHALKDGQPLHVEIAEFLRQRGFQVWVTKGEGAPISRDFIRRGDVYAVRHG